MADSTSSDKTVYDSRPKTMEHIGLVQKLICQDFQAEMMRRAGQHDLSKLRGIEKQKLDELEAVIAKEGPAKFGTKEYERRKELLGPMLDSHYANNDHHPEHHGKNGVAGMNLASLVEMFFDWTAAAQGREADQTMQLTAAIEKYKISAQLASILRNTADAFGIKYV